ncbi:uncharacterized protein TNCV_3149821 [Trichonephila clavipes]|nr:uncharacterized protein TNCV_3149821 [Trichonephila clavipes]
MQNHIATLGWEHHPPYSHDLIPSDYHLFPALKNFTKRGFGSNTEVKQSIKRFCMQSPEFFLRDILRLIKQCDKGFNGRERKTDSSAKENTSNSRSLFKFGYFPLVYTVWFFYSSLLTAKVILLFKLDVAQSLDANSAFGPQLLKVIIASSAVVFLLLVETHNNAETYSDHQAYINYLITSTVFEIFDSVTFLGILFPTESKIILTFPLENSVLILSCINFILPTLTLYKLSLSEFGTHPRSLGIPLLYKGLHLGLVNIPYFVIRVYLWSLYDHDVTLFLLKNILAMINTARTAVPDVKLWWHSLQESQGKRHKFFSGAMELGTVYEITDQHGDDGHSLRDEKKVLHSTEL